MRFDWLSPLPPVRSGIADYSVDLLPHLRSQGDVRVVALPYLPIAPEIAAAFAPVPFGELGAGGRVPLYQMGNNEYHLGVREAALRLPGVMVLHDVVLHHQLLNRTAGLGDLDSYRAELELDEGWVGAAAARPPVWGAWGQALQFALPAHRTLLRRQRGVLVHSRWAAGVIAEGDPEIAVRAVPMGVPLPPAANAGAGRAFREQWGLPADAFLLGSFGFQTPIKRSAEAILALAAPGLAEAHLLIVGEVASIVELDKIAAATGVGARVHVTGFLPFGEFQAAIAACDLCLNLRYPTAGETSASLLRVLAAGRPAVVSDHGHFAELPDDVAVQVALGDGELEALSAALGALAGDRQRLAAMGAAARAHVEREHDPERAAAAILAAAQELGELAPLADRAPLPTPLSTALRDDARGSIEVEGAASPWAAGERRRLRVRVRNTGPLRWLAGHRDQGAVAVAVRFRDSEGNNLPTDVSWFPLPSDLDAGEAWSFEVAVRRPVGPVRLLVEPRILDRGPMFRFGGPWWESAL